jgi:O-methyltransferase
MAVREHDNSTMIRFAAKAAQLSDELVAVTILAGVFPNDTGSLIEGRKFRFCHIDVDVYESA